jgi:Arc/MetJ-type ribon-helix-helix transcriptional regulator
MQQAKFSLSSEQLDFISLHKEYGFKDKSSMVRRALDHFQQELEEEKLKKSADLYSETYAESDDLRDLTESGLLEWPR